MRFLALLVAFVPIFFGCSTDLKDPTGTVSKNARVVVDVSGDVIKNRLIDAGFAGITQDSTVYGEKAYKIVYDSVDINGKPIKASGYMVVPKGMPKIVEEQLGFSIVSDDHGTIFKNSSARTVAASSTLLPSQDTAIIYTALGGFVTLMPDYVGYGQSRGAIHPFVMDKLADDTIAFIKAAKKVAEENGIKLNGQLFISGYSEGGYAAMATLKKIQQQGDLQVALATPMAGPYDLGTTAKGVLSAPKLSVPSFMAYVAYAYASANNIALDSIINEPYASKLKDLFDGGKSREEIDAQLTDDTTGLFVFDFITDFFQNDQNWFRKAVAQNSVHAWSPSTAVRLLHCQGDEVIPFGISQITLQTMKQLGAQDVELIPVEAALKQVGRGDGSLMKHGECAVFAYSLSAQLFAVVRKNSIGY